MTIIITPPNFENHGSIIITTLSNSQTSHGFGHTNLLPLHEVNFLLILGITPEIVPVDPINIFTDGDRKFDELGFEVQKYDCKDYLFITKFFDLVV